VSSAVKKNKPQMAQIFADEFSVTLVSGFSWKRIPLQLF
jgi:hypothetical protein